MIYCHEFKATFQTDATCRARQKEARRILALERTMISPFIKLDERIWKEELAKCLKCGGEEIEVKPKGRPRMNIGCKTPDCEGEHYGKGLCKKCYQRSRHRANKFKEERQKALRPDKEKLVAFAFEIEDIAMPGGFTSKEARAILAEAQMKLQSVAAYIKKEAICL